MEYTKDIYDWETNIVYISDKLQEFFPEFYGRFIDKLGKMGIECGVLKGTKDIWCRDYMPVQIEENLFVGYTYNPDYLDTSLGYPNVPHLNTLTGNELRTNQKEVWDKNGFNGRIVDCGLTIDGGNIVLCDKYIILTNKIYKENEGRSEKEIRETIYRFFGNRTPIIIPWRRVGEEVFGHSDGMVKFQRRRWDYKPYLLASMQTKKDSEVLFEALGEPFYLDILRIPDNLKAPGYTKYIWAYINYLQVGNKILVPAFDLPSDDYAMEIIRRYNPDCMVDSIKMREIADCGGALHCLTWNVKS